MKDTDLQKNFDQTDALIAILLAKVKASELALATVIASHPAPQEAMAIWNQAHLELADEGFDARVFPSYQPQLAKSLAMWSAGFRKAAGS